VSVDGGATCQFFIDKSSGAQQAYLVVTSSKNGNTWFSSKWDGTKTVVKPFAGLLSIQ
jgi:hypothetical protein